MNPCTNAATHHPLALIVLIIIACALLLGVFLWFKRVRFLRFFASFMLGGVLATVIAVHGTSYATQNCSAKPVATGSSPHTANTTSDTPAAATPVAPADDSATTGSSSAKSSVEETPEPSTVVTDKSATVAATTSPVNQDTSSTTGDTTGNSGGNTGTGTGTTDNSPITAPVAATALSPAPDPTADPYTFVIQSSYVYNLHDAITTDYRTDADPASVDLSFDPNAYPGDFYKVDYTYTNGKRTSLHVTDNYNYDFFTVTYDPAQMTLTFTVGSYMTTEYQGIAAGGSAGGDYFIYFTFSDLLGNASNQGSVEFRFPSTNGNGN